MHTPCFTEVKPVTLPPRLSFLTSSFSQAIHCKMGESMGPAGAKGPLAPGLLHNGKTIQLQEEQKKVNTSKKQKRRKCLVLVRVILKYLIKVLIFSKCIEFAQETSKFHLIKNAYTLGSLWFYLLPLSSLPHTNGKDLQYCSTTTSGKRILKNISAIWKRILPCNKSSKFPRKQHARKVWITLSHHPDKFESQRKKSLLWNQIKALGLTQLESLMRSNRPLLLHTSCTASMSILTYTAISNELYEMDWIIH